MTGVGTMGGPLSVSTVWVEVKMRSPDRNYMVVETPGNREGSGYIGTEVGKSTRTQHGVNKTHKVRV